MDSPDETDGTAGEAGDAGSTGDAAGEADHGADDADHGDDRDVPPLEHRAHFDIDVDEGYVHIEQSWGDRTLYTPDEARELAAEIAAAADRAGGET